MKRPAGIKLLLAIVALLALLGIANRSMHKFMLVAGSPFHHSEHSFWGAHH